MVVLQLPRLKILRLRRRFRMLDSGNSVLLRLNFPKKEATFGKGARRLRLRRSVIWWASKGSYGSSWRRQPRSSLAGCVNCKCSERLLLGQPMAKSHRSPGIHIYLLHLPARTISHGPSYLHNSTMLFASCRGAVFSNLIDKVTASVMFKRSYFTIQSREAVLTFKMIRLSSSYPR